MIQDIFPKSFLNQYTPREPRAQDYVLIYEKDNILLRECENGIDFCQYNDIKDEINVESLLYLFAIDEYAFYLTLQNIPLYSFSCIFQNIQTLRTFSPQWLAFAGLSGFHLYCWYRDNKYCGRCGYQMHQKESERAVSCSICNNTQYPKIAPAVIVGLTDGNRLLMTKYSRGYYRKYGLIAGFNEVGETLEETVRREVYEEVGLSVKNLTYYKNQPWGLSGSLLVGFYAEVDGETLPQLDFEELSDATWFERESIPEPELHISLTSEMICAFREGRY